MLPRTLVRWTMRAALNKSCFWHFFEKKTKKHSKTKNNFTFVSQMFSEQKHFHFKKKFLLFRNHIHFCVQIKIFSFRKQKQFYFRFKNLSFRKCFLKKTFLFLKNLFSFSKHFHFWSRAIGARYRHRRICKSSLLKWKYWPSTEGGTYKPRPQNWCEFFRFVLRSVSETKWKCFQNENKIFL